MARKATVNILMNTANMPMKSGSMMSLSQMRSMMGTSGTRKATGKSTGKKGRRGK